MGFKHAPSHRDSNHQEITNAYEELGCTVQDTSMVGFGFGDIVVGCVGLNHIVEIKTGEGRLEKAQERFIRDWRGAVRIVRTRQDVLDHVQSMRRSVR